MVNTMGQHARCHQGMAERTSRPQCQREPFHRRSLRRRHSKCCRPPESVVTVCTWRAVRMVDNMSYTDTHMHSFDIPATPSSFHSKFTKASRARTTRFTATLFPFSLHYAPSMDLSYLGIGRNVEQTRFPFERAIFAFLQLCT